MKCPDRDDLLLFRERALGLHQAGDVRGHLARCPACAARLAQLEQLIAELRTPIAASSRSAVARVMHRLDARRAPRRTRWQLGAALAAVLGVVAAWPVRDRGQFTARGGGGAALAPGHVTAEAIAREVGTSLFAVGARAEPLALGARVSPTTAYVLGYRDLSRAIALYALVFAVDANDDVHWLYPGFTAPGDDPPAVALAISDTTQLLPETVVLDHVPAGPLRMIVVVSAERMRVSQVERLRGAELVAPALRRRWPAAAITEQLLEVMQ